MASNAKTPISRGSTTSVTAPAGAPSTPEGRKQPQPKLPLSKPPSSASSLRSSFSGGSSKALVPDDGAAAASPAARKSAVGAASKPSGPIRQSFSGGQK